MRSYASCDSKKQQTATQSLPKVRNPSRQKPNQVEDSRSLSLMRSSIKGVVGEAISFYSNNNLGLKSKQKNGLDATLKSIFDKSVIVIKDRIDRADLSNSTNDKINVNSLSDYVSSMRYSFRKSKYYAFERLVKMNSDSYGAYHNWLRQKRKLSPAIMKITSVVQSKQEKIENNKTLMSCQSQEQKMSLLLESEKQRQQTDYKQKTLERILKKDVKINTKQKNNTKNDLEQLFVTRTNLIKKVSSNSESSPKKIPAVSYPQRKIKSYKYFLGPGNNHEIIKKVLSQTRGSNWIQTSEYDTLFNLKWEQYSDKSIYSRLDFTRYKQLVNHLQFHQSITTKVGLIETLKQYWAKAGHHVDIFQFVPLTFVFDWTEKVKFQDELKKFVYFYCQNHPEPEKLSKAQRDYVELSRQLWKGSKLPPNMSFDKNMLKKANTSPLESVFKDQKSKYLWIIKPSQYNRGRGIKLFSTLQQLRQIIKDSMPTDSFVIQKYIERPLLIKNRKFDIRVWVLISQEGDTYFFEEGYIRTSSEEFTLELYGNQDNYVHLTNNAVQKNSKNYGIFEQGNQLSFDDADRALQKQPGYFKMKWVPEIKKIIGAVIQAGIGKLTSQWKPKHHLNSLFIKQTYRVRVKNTNNNAATLQQPQLNLEKISLPRIPSPPSKLSGQTKNALKKGSFQIFGFDFMIDKEQKVWLIQVNTNPCLETSSGILEKLIPRMIDDAFKIVLDPVFKLSTKQDKSPYRVKDHEDSKNMWQPLSKIAKSI